MNKPLKTIIKTAPVLVIGVIELIEHLRKG